jgi:hypothetical protein
MFWDSSCQRGSCIDISYDSLTNVLIALPQIIETRRAGVSVHFRLCSHRRTFISAIFHRWIDPSRENGLVSEGVSKKE